jgi:uncharacterized protein
MSFLTAEWKNLIMVNYAIDKEVIQQYLPYKTEADIFDDTCYVSLVGFMFYNTRLMGIKIPFHVNFGEINLRFYVKRKDGNTWKRGVVFIKELVPKHALTFVANTVYKEKYETVPMNHQHKITDEKIEVEYGWISSQSKQSIRVTAENKIYSLDTGSETEFITEHFWGYTKVTENKTYEYEVKHPRWQVYRVKEFEVKVDFGLVYGNNLSFLNAAIPKSVMLAEGSRVSVENRKIL